MLGICPGPGILNLVTLDTNSVVFVLSMSFGMLVFKLLECPKINKTFSM
ncbi:hypothetical protein [Halobacteriovorax marinus]